MLDKQPNQENQKYDNHDPVSVCLRPVCARNVQCVCTLEPNRCWTRLLGSLDSFGRTREVTSLTKMKNVATLSTFSLIRMLDDCPAGSEAEREIQKELDKRTHKRRDTGTLPLPLEVEYPKRKKPK